MENPYVRFHQVCQRYRTAKRELEPIADLLRSALQSAAHHHGQVRIANHLKISPAYLNDILHGRREISENFANQVVETAVLKDPTK